LPALPAALAARRARDPARGKARPAGGGGPAAGVRGAGGGLGAPCAPGPRRRVPRLLARGAGPVRRRRRGAAEPEQGGGKRQRPRRRRVLRHPRVAGQPARPALAGLRHPQPREGLGGPPRPRPARLFRTLAVGVPSGRWALLPSMSGGTMAAEELAEAWAEQLLTRYGVVFRDAVQREGLSLPRGDVLRALRRLEARGLGRGGRFVAGVYGPEARRPERR